MHVTQDEIKTGAEVASAVAVVGGGLFALLRKSRLWRVKRLANRAAEEEARKLFYEGMVRRVEALEARAESNRERESLMLESQLLELDILEAVLEPSARCEGCPVKDVPDRRNDASFLGLQEIKRKMRAHLAAAG